MKLLSVIMPVLDEEAEIVAALEALAPLRRRGVEVVVADGGSSDATVVLARPLCDRLVAAPRGRALQMNAGAAAARGNVFVFLHADTRLPADADRIVFDALSKSSRVWGRFDVAIEGRHPLFPVIATMMNLRSRVTGIATGDQAIFCTRAAFAAAGSYPFIPLMEDIVFSRRLKRQSDPITLGTRVLTSGRRWVKHGVMRTILLMWGLRFAFFVGVSPERLAKWYGHARGMA
ncbi:TIGR04283 family arsenosugar biosynthesis glycosyltransferase [Xanthobacteraceae bacterium Astr-EGSB]|uniref:TIGR04283 family arsenosugar biosynthesis glycosyltransferase n=1 Tax=Astrobacterium formosum TaxID=3069710 RepID=UPI0027B40BEC|nr:TIGR04283 family arsenosugar biosynthesis glycosyltransferase [Xanthobacteraceae bacterium Astr-EGSB]